MSLVACVVSIAAMVLTSIEMGNAHRDGKDRLFLVLGACAMASMLAGLLNFAVVVGAA